MVGTIRSTASHQKSLPTRKRREAEPKYVYTEAATYQYNDEGIRTVKIVNGIRHEYDVVGGQINREVIRSSSSATSAVMKDIRYYYAVADWILLFQMASISEDDYELMYGDMGNLYFYIRKQDMQERKFDRVWFAVQCG